MFHVHFRKYTNNNRRAGGGAAPDDVKMAGSGSILQQRYVYKKKEKILSYRQTKKTSTCVSLTFHVKHELLRKIEGQLGGVAPDDVQTAGFGSVVKQRAAKGVCLVRVCSCPKETLGRFAVPPRTGSRERCPPSGDHRTCVRPRFQQAANDA